ncbi:MAG: hypothetical protein FWF51_06500 [Chitinivibrionia bacterium]|nr:hypothetical protein [Chitinivibrionia bacterium]
MKLNKKDFVEKVRGLAHSEPQKDIWENMYRAYCAYPNASVGSVVENFRMHKTQKSEFDEMEIARKQLREKIKEWER